MIANMFTVIVYNVWRTITSWLQFRRVLSGLELAGVFSDFDFDIVYRKFAVKMGGRNDVNYIAFCGMVERYAEDKWIDPALQWLVWQRQSISLHNCTKLLISFPGRSLE